MSNYREEYQEADFDRDMAAGSAAYYPQNDQKGQTPNKGQNPNRRSRRKQKNYKGTALLVAFLLATGAAGGILISSALEARDDYNRAAKLTGAYQTEAYCIIPERIYTSQNHDFVYSTGKHVTQAAANKDIEILKIGDTFITQDGSPVARVLLEVQTVESVDIIKCENDGQEFYIEPEGYVWNNNTQKCERVSTSVVERYVYANSDHNYGNVRVPGSTVLSVLSFEEYPSISYEEAEAMELIADVDDDYVKTDANVVTEARLVLVPDNQK